MSDVLGDPSPCVVCGWLTTEYVGCCYSSICSSDCNCIHQAREHLVDDAEPRLLPPAPPKNEDLTA